MKKMQFLANPAAAIALLAATAVLNAQPILYSTTGGGSTLVRIDVGAGTVTTIGDFGVPAADAIAISPKGKLYTVTQGWPPTRVNLEPQLASVDLATGQATPFGVNLYPEIFMGIGFSRNGKLYGVNADSGTPNQNSLYRFDLETGQAKKVGVKGGCGDIMDLAWYHGTMYGAAWDSLYRIDLHTGQAELVTKLHYALTDLPLTRVMGLAIDDDGNFYVTEIVADAPLWRVDPVTGAATAVAGVSLNKPHGLEFIPTDADDDDKDADDDDGSDGHDR
jgi:sugar lactone lactonase YvrE